MSHNLKVSEPSNVDFLTQCSHHSHGQKQSCLHPKDKFSDVKETPRKADIIL